MHRTPKSRRARRQAGSLALATLLVISTACTSSKADGAKATASHPTTTAAIKLDQAYKKHTVAWVSTLAIGTSILNLRFRHDGLAHYLEQLDVVAREVAPALG